MQEGSAPALFLQACGFRVTRRLLVFESDDQRFAAAMTALLARFDATRRIPRGVGLAMLGEVPAAGIAKLVAAHFRPVPHGLAQRLAAQSRNGYDPNLSLAVLRGSEAVGAMLCRRAGDLLDIDVSVVAPEFRRGWANLAMLEAMIRQALAAGITRFRFACEEHVRDTMNLARRSFARPLPPELVLVLPLGDSERATLPADGTGSPAAG